MILFPNCKINLGLNITSKRADGYHNLETVFYPIPFKDALEIIEADKFSFTQSGLSYENEGKNLCEKAYDLLKQDFPKLPPVAIYLLKSIPVGAGLGGGSSDASCTLKLLNKKFNLGISEQGLLDYAFKLGSDCPYFIYNKPCYATGRGEKLERIDVNLSGFTLLLVNPQIIISTAEAFGSIIPQPPNAALPGIMKLPVTAWRDVLKNDFETSVFAAHPEIEEIKTKLYDSGAIYASMTGSGSSVYGLFKTEIPAKLNSTFNLQHSTFSCTLQ